MNRFKFAPQKLSLSESDTPQKVQLLKTGKFKDAWMGEFEITPETLSSMMSNFDSNVRGVDLAIDYSHANYDVAAGWIKSLDSNGSELWATVDWTPKAKEKLKNKEFRYLSAEFSFEYEDNESDKKFGPTLFGAGLTNRPFVKNMAPAVQLSEGEKEMDPKDKEIADLKAQAEETKKALNAKESELVEMKSKLDALDAEVKKASEEKALAEKTAKFNSLMTEGKVVEAQRESFMSGDAVKLAELSQAVKLTEKGHGDNSAAPSNKAEAEIKILELAEKMLAEKQVKSISEGILLARKENPELVKLITERK